SHGRHAGGAQLCHEPTFEGEILRQGALQQWGRRVCDLLPDHIHLFYGRSEQRLYRTLICSDGAAASGPAGTGIAQCTARSRSDRVSKFPLSHLEAGEDRGEMPALAPFTLALLESARAGEDPQMRCPACQVENRAENRFCEACGASLM